jgi:NADH:ubiquinone oxidoreductase subunit 3 (subunit A)
VSIPSFIPPCLPSYATEVPIGPAWVQFPVGFYLVALVFIVFDALAVFLFPWSLVLRAVGLTAFWTMGAFVGIIALGWVYAYREGILEWK